MRIILGEGPGGREGARLGLRSAGSPAILRTTAFTSRASAGLASSLARSTAWWTILRRPARARRPRPDDSISSKPATYRMARVTNRGGCATSRPGGLNPAEVAHDPEDQVLAPSPLGSRHGRRGKDSISRSMRSRWSSQRATRPHGGLPGAFETRFDKLRHSPLYSPVHAFNCATMNSEAVSALIAKNPSLKALQAQA